MEKIVELGLLYDFYGELLTARQKEILESFILDDLSLSEIGELYSVSRQGVHDMIRRSTVTLRGYEEKLKLVEKFMSIKEKAAQIDSLLRNRQGEDIDKVKEISREILQEL
ncbi:YlxM family DNA-binding protein [Ohessyouella blattaphilus]|uniref:UPF0122 protein NK118_03675 n=1 Tax=Ohessyouella blattaphilus TaxID=2949333 RepID=A0ABT1EHV3_9FIRM|nr:YlxM family DNA-binding protein [Ohessyouella blattaphilus]MCP1109347.1 YlxM family DNA-binding protein [Ohessyouella blattaphilus]MCR8562741.1 YlxM family DNA-binding protein [Ohessyouella blattaphilus]